MLKPIFRYCYYSFKGADGSKQELRLWVTDSLSLEWKLYVNDIMVGHHLDVTTNILIPEQLERLLSYNHVTSMYEKLFQQI